MTLSDVIESLHESPNAIARRIGRTLATAARAAERNDARAVSAAADRIDRALVKLRENDPELDANAAEYAAEYARDFAHGIAMRDGEDFFPPEVAPSGRIAAEAATRAARAAMERPFAGVAARLAEIVAELANLRAESTCEGSRAITRAALALCDAIELQNEAGTLGVAAATLAARDGIAFSTALAILASENNLPADPALRVIRHDDGSMDRA